MCVATVEDAVGRRQQCSNPSVEGTPLCLEHSIVGIAPRLPPRMDPGTGVSLEELAFHTCPGRKHRCARVHADMRRCENWTTLLERCPACAWIEHGVLVDVADGGVRVLAARTLYPGVKIRGGAAELMRATGGAANVAVDADGAVAPTRVLAPGTELRRCTIGATDPGLVAARHIPRGAPSLYHFPDGWARTAPARMAQLRNLHRTQPWLRLLAFQAVRREPVGLALLGHKAARTGNLPTGAPPPRSADDVWVLVALASALHRRVTARQATFRQQTAAATGAVTPEAYFAGIRSAVSGGGGGSGLFASRPDRGSATVDEAYLEITDEVLPCEVHRTVFAELRRAIAAPLLEAWPDVITGTARAEEALRAAVISALPRHVG